MQRTLSAALRRRPSSLLHTSGIIRQPLYAHTTQRFALSTRANAPLPHPLPPLSVLMRHYVQNSTAEISAWFAQKGLPKGFEKFFEDEKSAGGEEAAKDQQKKTDDSKKSSGGGGNGGGDGGNKGNPYTNYSILGSVLGFMAFAWVVNTVFGGDMPTPWREITFQDFVRDFLLSDSVEKIVINSESMLAQVQLKPSAAAAHPVPTAGAHQASHALNRVVSFKIGSIDSFERNMENLQLDMGRHPKDFVPVCVLCFFSKGSDRFCLHRCLM
jgi:hypothetical protein